MHIKKVRSKRGSCSHDQKLVFNQELVHLPTKFIHYVVVHEVCHLKEKNHSSAFRSLLQSFLPDYKILRKELKNFSLVRKI
ncbi:MAG: M48 family metallopeptidase [bacterium]|nr:M48 family metallopeptidase [bacterium]